MSMEFVKEIEIIFYNNETKSHVITDQKKVFLKIVFKYSSSQILLYFFSNIKQFLTYQGETHSYIMYSLINSQLSTTTMMKTLIRDVIANQLDGNDKTVFDYYLIDDELNNSSNKNIFSYKYVKLKQYNLYSSTKTLQHICLSKNISSGPINLPNHEVNIVQFLGVNYYRNTWLLAMETMPLSKLDNPSSSLHNEVHVLNDVANGLKYLHSQGQCVIHHNLVANNILSSTSLNNYATFFLKLTDSQKDCHTYFYLILQVNPSCRPSAIQHEWISKECSLNIHQITIHHNHGLYLTVKNNFYLTIASIQLDVIKQKEVSAVFKEMLQLITEFQLFSKTIDISSFEMVQSFILTMQQRQCVLPHELINYMHLHSVHHMISYTGVKQPTESACIATEATEEIGYSQLVVCADIKAQKMNEIETKEAIQEEAFALSDEKDLHNHNYLSQFMENDIYEKMIELAMAASKFESPTALLECAADELKIWIFAKTDAEIKKASFSVPLHDTYCRHYPFTELCGLWQFINDMNKYFLQEMPFSLLYKMIIAPITQHFNFLGVPKLDQCIIVPHDDMRLVPYHALLDSHSGNVFGEKCELTIIPSTSLLQEMNRNKVCNNIVVVPGEEDSFLIVGNPTIPSFEPLSYATREDL